jgi:hypothetical protein
MLRRPKPSKNEVVAPKEEEEEEEGLTLNVTRLTSYRYCHTIRWSYFQISVLKPSIIIYITRGFPQSLEENMGFV